MCRIAQGRWVAAIENGNVRHGVVGEAVKLVVDLGDALLGTLDVGVQGAEAVPVVRAALDTREGHNTVVDNPTDVCGLVGGGARQNLSDEVRGERCDVADNPLLVGKVYNKYIKHRP